MTLTLGKCGHIKGIKSHFCTFLSSILAIPMKLGRDITKSNGHLFRKCDLKRPRPQEIAAILYQVRKKFGVYYLLYRPNIGLHMLDYLTQARLFSLCIEYYYNCFLTDYYRGKEHFHSLNSGATLRPAIVLHSGLKI